MKKIITLLMITTLVCTTIFAATKRVMVDGKPKMLEVSEVWEYDKFGNLINDGERLYKYNEDGKPLERPEIIGDQEYDFKYEYDDQGRLIHKYDNWNGYHKYYSYDSNGKVCYEGDKPTKEKAWEYKLYEDGKLMYRNDGLYDVSNTETYTYNKHGDLTRVDYYSAYFNKKTCDIYEYNENNQLTRKFLQSVKETGYEVKYDYDENGNCIYIEDLENGSILREYDKDSHITYEYSDEDGERYFKCDDRGNVIEERKPKESEKYNKYKDDKGTILTRSYVYKYNEDGQLILYEDHSYYYRTDYFDNVLAVEDRIDEKEEWDNKGRVTYHLGDDIVWKKGYQRSYETHWAKFEYDDQDRVIKVTTPTDTYAYSYEKTSTGGTKRYEFVL